jgi:hypothetical protein
MEQGLEATGRPLPSRYRGVAEPDPKTLRVAHLLLSASQALLSSMESMIESMSTSCSVPTPAAVLQARRNAEARDTLLQEFGAFTSAELAELAGSKAKNKAALAHRWRQEGRIFSVLHHGDAYFPGFQFDAEGRPREVVARVIEALGPESSDWELALWLTSPCGWLGGARPVDLLEGDPQSVAEAARREAAELVF